MSNKPETSFAARRLAGWCVAALLAVGCGSVKHDEDGGVSPDAAVADGGVQPPDAMPSAADAGAQASPPSAEITAGGATLQGATYRMHLQLGHPYRQEPMSGAGTTLEGNAAVKP